MTHIDILNNFRDAIKAEHDLTTARLNTFLVFTSFLMTGFAIGLNSTNLGGDLFLKIVPWGGIMISVYAAIVIFAAVYVQSRMITFQKRAIDRMLAHIQYNDGTALPAHEAEHTLLTAYSQTTYHGRECHWTFHWLPVSLPLVLPLIVGGTWIYVILERPTIAARIRASTETSTAAAAHCHSIMPPSPTASKEEHKIANPSPHADPKVPSVNERPNPATSTINEVPATPAAELSGDTPPSPTPTPDK